MCTSTSPRNPYQLLQTVNKSRKQRAFLILHTSLARNSSSIARNVGRNRAHPKIMSHNNTKPLGGHVVSMPTTRYNILISPLTPMIAFASHVQQSETCSYLVHSTKLKKSWYLRNITQGCAQLCFAIQDSSQTERWTQPIEKNDDMWYILVSMAAIQYAHFKHRVLRLADTTRLRRSRQQWQVYPKSSYTTPETSTNHPF